MSKRGEINNNLQTKTMKTKLSYFLHVFCSELMLKFGETKGWYHGYSVVCLSENIIPQKLDL